MAKTKNHPHNRREQLALAEKEQEIVHLYFQKGLSQQAIAKQMGIGQTTVSRYVRQAHARWQETSIQDIEEHKARILENLAHTKAEAWSAWLDSKNPVVANTVREGGKLGDSTEQTTTTQTGDPKYLAVIQNAIDQERKLLGLDAPTKHQVATVDMGDLQTIASVMTGSMERAGLSAEQIRAVVEYFAEGMKEVVK